MSNSSEKDELSEVLEELSLISSDPPSMRECCLKCRRPKTVCWCPFLPAEPVAVSSFVIILQHPGEEKRCLRTAPMLEACLPVGHCMILKGRRFSSYTCTKLRPIYNSSNTILMYPGPQATPLEDLPTIKDGPISYNIIILDGTWPQAKSMYRNTEELRRLKQVQIHPSQGSDYVIRTQPTEKSLSTVETAALALSVLESNPAIHQILIQPLKALCNFQLKHGAVTHHSKEFLSRNGLDKKINVSSSNITEQISKDVMR
ncbi:tRNA-uridine aminocarboxypropyltransferase 2 [Centruroides vittatus]|uniref:tRNA-uridine aminocarboxypropyltransferase 2 n=1 Tax=Centruroides vittatus TaxID=120091 RepID=UPI00350EA597